ncbi:TPA: hypothetical protein PXE20_000625 [Mannheimia haemolytica]|uniref:hypothetical protein n=1 Tax=Mannheimia haemolytica TaxID=75985 RepID=UPI0001BCF692|nr:hypothetical protein [Mannheimia haemolytica]EEY10665.1 hypothetical protein COI_0687 [Mannheimia haemolytica serotype A2 str. OVINE]MDW0624109.1 hypothetical protein [Mannheimia haemolytica]HDL5235642.1 hypothetical protein [Mannheimia haemolytica]HDL5278693.1 hypothetical protein [Mannheimia haemolytica]HDL5341324.1 hypothetical protein [Mannheimia haemolytica]
MNTEDQIIELTVEVENLRHQLNAKNIILDDLEGRLTDYQRKRLDRLFERSRRQYLNDLDLEEEQAEALEAICNELESFLAN